VKTCNCNTHKLHIGTPLPYRGKHFLTRQIPTSCLPKSGGIISELLFILFPEVSLDTIVAEKNVTKNGHIQNVCSMCIKINKVGKQEVGI
jgi:hypothetical protein